MAKAVRLSDRASGRVGKCLLSGFRKAATVKIHLLGKINNKVQSN